MHPPAFHRRFGDEMLSIFDEDGVRDSGFVLLDGLLSIARQWVLRTDCWRMPKSLQAPASRYIPKGLLPLLAQLIRFSIHAGLLRLFGNGVAAPGDRLSMRDTLVVHTLQLQPKMFDASLSIPLIVLSGAKRPEVNLDDEYESELLDRFMDYRVHVTQAHLAPYRPAAVKSS
jgi:hypothetical protein